MRMDCPPRLRTTCARPLVALDCAFWGSFDDSSYQPPRKRQKLHRPFGLRSAYSERLFCLA